MAALGVSHSTSPFAQAAPELIRLGYNPLPIVPTEKRPGEYRGGAWRGMSEWERFRDRQPSQFELSLWMRNYPDANVGVVLGSEAVSADGEVLHVIAVDIDCPDHDDFEAVFRSLPRSPMRKRGAKGETLFYLAAKTIRSRPYSRATDRTRLVDVLTGFDARQTVCPPSAHPSGAVYVWTAGPCAAAALPVFGPEDLEKLEETLQGLGWSVEAERATPAARPVSSDSIDEDDFFSETKRAALSRLDAWVTALDLYGLRPARGGYEAVATWRASGSGRPLEQRKRNLSIQANGITDFGDGPKGYSAIDLVMAARGCEQAEATSWLRAQLGLADEGVTIALQPSDTSDPGRIHHETASPLVVSAPTPPALDELPDSLTRVPGLLGELTNWICDTSRRPQRGLALGAALTILGTAAGRKYAGPTRTGTHLYVLALAKTGSGKDHAQNAIMRAMEQSGLGSLIGPPQFMSISAIVNVLHRKPLSVCVMDEFGDFLGRLFAKGSSGHEKSISGILRTAWGKSFQTYLTPEYAGKSSETIYSPAMSLYGASTHQEFYNALTGAAVSNGFLNRFLIISSNKPGKHAKPTDSGFDVPERITRYLARVHAPINVLASATANNGRADEPALVVPWENATAEAIYTSLSLEMEELEHNADFFVRTAEMAQRLATIRAIGLSADAPLISVADMEWGRDLALWSANRMLAETLDYVADTPHQAEAQRVLRTIKEHGRISRANLIRALGQKATAKGLDETMSGLIEAELVVCEEDTTSPARRKPRWYRALATS